MSTFCNYGLENIYFLVSASINVESCQLQGNLKANYDRNLHTTVIFESNVSFNSSKFFQKANFVNVMFNGEVDFSGANFEKVAVFRNSSFNGEADFWSSSFNGRVGSRVLYSMVSRPSGRLDSKMGWTSVTLSSMVRRTSVMLAWKRRT